MPGWVKWPGLVLGVLAVIFVALRVAGVQHGPAGHNRDRPQRIHRHEPAVQYAIVPLALASVAIGIINASGTPWGLMRHYWVLVKLVLTIVAAAVLLHEAGTVAGLADAATSRPDPRELSSTLPHSIGGLIVLSTTVILSVFKPRGLTRYGWRKQQQRRPQPAAEPTGAAAMR
jgi:hypothetical protein